MRKQRQLILSRIPVWPTSPRSTSLTPWKAAAIAFQQKALLLLDDCLHALQRQIPSLSRLSLNRLCQRDGLSRLLKDTGLKRDKKSFSARWLGNAALGLQFVVTGGVIDKIERLELLRKIQQVVESIGAPFRIRT